MPIYMASVNGRACSRPNSGPCGRLYLAYGYYNTVQPLETILHWQANCHV